MSEKNEAQQQPPPPVEQAVVPAEPVEGRAVAIPQGASELQAFLDEETARRKIITQFIKENLKEDVDYGRIHISRGCPDVKSQDGCKNLKHWSKNCLFKPGAEKFCSLMHLTPKFSKDDETLAVIPEGLKREYGIVAMRCDLYSKEGRVVSEGRGVCSFAEKDGNINTAIKICEKRAMMDAVLRAYSISDSFTQDIEDGGNIDVESKEDRGPAGDERPAQDAQKPPPASAPLAPEEELEKLKAQAQKIFTVFGWKKKNFALYVRGVLQKDWDTLNIDEQIRILRELKKLFLKMDAEGTLPKKENPKPKNEEITP